MITMFCKKIGTLAITDNNIMNVSLKNYMTIVNCCIIGGYEKFVVESRHAAYVTTICGLWIFI